MSGHRNHEGYPDPTAWEAINSTTEKSYKRQITGAQSRAAGEIFENMISASLRWYENRGVACVEKTPEPMRPLRPLNRQGQFIACYVKAAQPDFKGTLNGGRSVVFEAKHTSGTKIEASRVTDEQRGRLLLHHRLGATVFVLVSFDLTDFYRVPWDVWENMSELFGHKHMKKQDCEPYRVPHVAGVIKLLDGILTMPAEGGGH